GKRIVDPARPSGLSGADHLVVKSLPAGVLLPRNVGPFPRGEGRVEQDVALEVVSEQVRVALKPLAPRLPELGERGLSLPVDECRRLLDQGDDASSLRAIRRGALSADYGRCCTPAERTQEDEQSRPVHLNSELHTALCGARCRRPKFSPSTGRGAMGQASALRLAAGLTFLSAPAWSMHPRRSR